MGLFSSLFGKKTVSAAPTPAPRSEVEDIRHQIEITEGELHDARVSLEQAADESIKESFRSLVSRKTQALQDLEDKLRAAQARVGK